MEQKQETSSANREGKKRREGWDPRKAAEGSSERREENTHSAVSAETRNGECQEVRYPISLLGGHWSIQQKHFRREEGGGARLLQMVEGMAGQVRRWP